jgi:hypothetical protein
MRSSSVALLFLLGVAMASRLSLADARGMSGSGTSIADMVGQELRGLVARADNMFRSAAGWHTTAESKNMRAVAAEPEVRRRRAVRNGRDVPQEAGYLRPEVLRRRAHQRQPRPEVRRQVQDVRAHLLDRTHPGAV